MIKKMTDLRHVNTGVQLTRAERMEAQLRHMVASHHAQLIAKRAENNRRGLKPMVIGSGHVPALVARAFAYVKVA